MMYHLQEYLWQPNIDIKYKKDRITKVSMEPLPWWFGVTIGNVFRRVLLSSIAGVAVVKVEIEGVGHEYTVLEWVKDTVLDIILNLKQIRFKKEIDWPVEFDLDISGREWVVTARDIDCVDWVEVINKDQYITELDNKKVSFKIKFYLENGFGFKPASDIPIEGTQIAVDAIFSPIRRVKYNVTQARVWDMTNLDKLEVEIETDGSIDGYDALKRSSNILKYYFGILDESADDEIENMKARLKEKEEEEKVCEETETFTLIEVLSLSQRTLNALINNDIDSVEKLEKFSRRQLMWMKGFGKKALTEVEMALKGMGKILRER